jgi:hypothetical protein
VLFLPHLPFACSSLVLHTYSSIFSAIEIKSSFSLLEAETAELKRATRLAELATSSVDGFKLMLAEKMRLENEMKKRYSIPRLQWIKAINRVLIQNYVAKVRIRLGMTTPPSEPVELKPILTQHDSKRKIYRKSIDNSLLPSINKAHSNSSMLHHPSGGNGDREGTTFPSLNNGNGGSNNNNQRDGTMIRRRRAGTDGQLHTRKTYTITDNKMMDKSLSKSSDSNSSSGAGYGSVSPSSVSAVPSLVQSYQSYSQRILPQTSVPTLTDVREHSNRAMKLLKL